MGQVLQRVLQEARRQDRAALRVPASGLPLTGRRATGSCGVVAAALALSLASCSTPAVDRAAGQGAGGGIAVRTSADGVTIENRTTRPLLNVRVTVTAAGSDTPFVRIVPTIDPNQ